MNKTIPIEEYEQLRNDSETLELMRKHVIPFTGETRISNHMWQSFLIKDKDGIKEFDPDFIKSIKHKMMDEMSYKLSEMIDMEETREYGVTYKMTAHIFDKKAYIKERDGK